MNYDTAEACQSSMSAVAVAGASGPADGCLGLGSASQMHTREHMMLARCKAVIDTRHGVSMPSSSIILLYQKTPNYTTLS